MRVFRLAVVTLVFMGFAAAAEPWFFVQMSDPQFGVDTDNRDFAQETANFEFAIATANRWKPTFVVITGDLTHRAGDAAQMAEFHRIKSKLSSDIKVYAVPGNHDVEREPTHESLAAYREHYGPDYYSFRQGNMAGFVLNSSILQFPEKVRDEYDKQEKWLRAELAKAKQDGVAHLVVFQHISFFMKSPDESDSSQNIPLERRKHYLDLLKEFGVRNVLAGHAHRNSVGTDGNLMLITTGPVSKPQGDDECGMRVAIVTDKGIRTEYLGFSRLPNRVEVAATAAAGK